MRKLAVAGIIFVLLIFNSSHFEMYIYGQSKLDVHVTARAAILVEQHSGRVLFAKNARERIYPASMTKMLTAMVMLEHFDDLHELILTGPEILYVPQGSSLSGHVVGESISVENLIRGLIMPSGNETAIVVASTVAQRVSGSSMPYREAEAMFGQMMNEMARRVGAVNSNFVNPHGFHDPNHYSTAYDLALIGRAAMENDVIRRIAAETRFQNYGAGRRHTPDLRTRRYAWTTHNQLLRPDSDFFFPYATGIKTGFHNEAGFCVAASATRDGRELVAVIWNSTSLGRWQDSINLFEFGFNAFDDRTVQQAGQFLSHVLLHNAPLAENDSLEVLAYEDFVMLLSQEELDRLEVTITFSEAYTVPYEELNTYFTRLRTPIEEYAVIGRITYRLDGLEIYNGPVVAGRAVSERSYVDDVRYFFRVTRQKVSVVTLLAIFAVILLTVAFFMVNAHIAKNKKRYQYKMREARRRH